MDNAIQSMYGVVVECSDTDSANVLRRRCYRVREKARDIGDGKYELLGFVIEENVLKIIRKDKVGRTHQPSYMVRPLRFRELPSHICSRGFAKPPLSSILMHSMMVEEYEKATRTLTKQDLLELIPPKKKKP